MRSLSQTWWWRHGILATFGEVTWSVIWEVTWSSVWWDHAVRFVVRSRGQPRDEFTWSTIWGSHVIIRLMRSRGQLCGEVTWLTTHPGHVINRWLHQAVKNVVRSRYKPPCELRCHWINRMMIYHCQLRGEVKWLTTWQCHLNKQSIWSRG
jgi:hypothetical protein